MYLPPPQIQNVVILQLEDVDLSESSDKINEFQLKWNGYLSKIKPVLIDNKHSIISKLSSFSQLPENWDGHDAIPPYNEAISNCIKFLNRLPENIISIISNDSLVPTNYGTIVFNLSNSNNEIVSLEFGKTKIGFYTKFNDNHNFQINEISYNYNLLPPDLISAITKLYKSYIF
ncbi:MAG: hypothetical protein U0W65_15070 [Bacteroidia bacterium]